MGALLDGRACAGGGGTPAPPPPDLAHPVMATPMTAPDPPARARQVFRTTRMAAPHPQDAMSARANSTGTNSIGADSAAEVNGMPSDW